MSAAVSPAGAAEALGMLRSAMGYLSATDATAMAAETQAQCLLALEQLDAIETAARSSILAAFTSGQGYSADADYSSRAWLINKTRVTKGAASGHLGWVRRAAAHPQVVAALAEGHILSESVARRICQWTDKLPEDCRLAADAILIVAAKAGADLRGLAELAAEIYARSLPDTPTAIRTRRLPGRPVGHGGQLGASGGVDRLGPGRLGCRAGRSVGRRERRGGVAGQRCRPRGRLRRVGHPGGYRRREPGCPR